MFVQAFVVREAVRGRKGTIEVNCKGQVGTWDIPRTP